MNATDLNRVLQLVDEFDDFAWCQCSDCKCGASSHGADYDKTMKQLRDFLQEALSVDIKRGPLQEIATLLSDHPTNVGVGTEANWRPLNPGEEGYDHRARYALLVAKDALRTSGGA
jgi:hypothetical protein